MDEAAQRRRRRRRLKAALVPAGLIGLVLAAGWIERRQIASGIVDRRLAAAGVPARYRLAAIGPFTQVIEDVRLGDPARPDLVARRVRLDWRYGLAGPRLAAVRAEGVRVEARWVDGRLSLGALDRLLPKSGGAAALPAIAASLNDVRVALRLPSGAVEARLDGTGNLARDFRGRLRLAAPALAPGGCVLREVGGTLAIAVADRRPRLTGPLVIAATDCAAPGLRLTRGAIALDLRLAPSLDGADGRVAFAGFAGGNKQARFAGARGALTLTYARGGAQGRGTIALDGPASPYGRADAATIAGAYRLAADRRAFDGTLALRGAVAAIDRRTTIGTAVGSARSTPLAPLAARIGAVADAIAAGADWDARVRIDDGPTRAFHLDRATIRARGRVAATASATVLVAGGGWRATGALAGADLPTLHVRAARARDGAPTMIAATIAPYRAGAATLATTPLRIVVGREGTRFATIATISGPFSGGAIEGLEVPLAGTIDRAGTLRLADGCGTIRFRTIAAAGARLDPGGVKICGAPVLLRRASGEIAVAATARDVSLTGRVGAAPLGLRAGALRLSSRGFAAERVDATLGPPDDPTRLALAAIEGRWNDATGGTVAAAAGAIGHVPLALSAGAGTWAFADRTLRLAGTLEVRDRAAEARFAPLAADAVALSLAGGIVEARAELRPLGRTERVASVALRHDLARGTGGADIAVPALAFARGGLQPELLTPLTLGVVANVAGTVSGAGRIDWSPQGVASNGAFRTEGLDFAAAFGPVTGLAGTIRFTDLLGLVTAPHQEARIGTVNPGVAVSDGVAQYRLIGGDRVEVEDARWPFAGGTLSLDPTMLDFARTAERRLSFRIAGLDAAAFIQQLDFPNIAATGTFDGRLPMVFDQAGGRIEAGSLTSRGPGTVAYVGELSNAALGTMGKLAFDALKSIRYAGLDVSLGGRIDGEIVTRVRFDGVHRGTGDSGLIARMIRDLPFRFNITIRAPFQGLVGSARSYADPRLLLQQVRPPAVQPADSTVRR